MCPLVNSVVGQVGSFSFIPDSDNKGLNPHSVFCPFEKSEPDKKVGSLTLNTDRRSWAK